MKRAAMACTGLLWFISLNTPVLAAPKPVAPATKPQIKQPSNEAKSNKSLPINTNYNSNEPVYITSDHLQLESEKRLFTYSGNVKVVQGDTTITGQLMVGEYLEDNRIKIITATKDVVITKGLDMHATGQRAVYDAIKGTVVLTENPHLFQGGSDLSADRVVMYLNENRSSAEGQVRMKVIKTPGQSLSGLKNNIAAPAVTVTPTPAETTTPDQQP